MRHAALIIALVFVACLNGGDLSERESRARLLVEPLGAIQSFRCSHPTGCQEESAKSHCVAVLPAGVFSITCGKSCGITYATPVPIPPQKAEKQ